MVPRIALAVLPPHPTPPHPTEHSGTGPTLPASMQGGKTQRSFSGSGADEDIVVSSARAYIRWGCCALFGWRVGLGAEVTSAEHAVAPAACAHGQVRMVGMQCGARG